MVRSVAASVAGKRLRGTMPVPTGRSPENSASRTCCTNCRGRRRSRRTPAPISPRSPTRRDRRIAGFAATAAVAGYATRIGMRWPTSAMTSVGLRTCSMPSTTTSPTPETVVQSVTGHRNRHRYGPRRLPPAGTAPSGAATVALDLADDRLLRRCSSTVYGRLCRRNASVRWMCVGFVFHHSRGAHRPHFRGMAGPLPTTRPPEQSPGGPNQPPFPPNREFYERILPFIRVSCTGYACCADHWNHCPTSGNRPGAAAATAAAAGTATRMTAATAVTVVTCWVTIACDCDC